MPEYVIAGPWDDEDGTLYWSNDDGWGSLDTATVFTEVERATLNLPDAEGATPEWVTLDQAKRWVKVEDILRRHDIAPEYAGDCDERYLAILAPVIDGESGAADTFSTLEAAADWLSTGYDNSNPREPALVIDLDTEKLYTPRTVVTVYLDEEE